MYYGQLENREYGGQERKDQYPSHIIARCLHMHEA